MKNYELIPDARNLMESTRSIGYSLSAAVADLVDNSIAAEADLVEIWTPVSENDHLLILDNGFGMTHDDLLTAMRYGSRNVGERRRPSDLGRFGLGLKMASLSQCRRLTVLSKKKGMPLVGARWDLDHVAETICPWALQILEDDDFSSVPWSDKLEQRESGTLVVWEKLDMFFRGIKETGHGQVLLNKVSELKSHLSLVFHRYIEGDDMNPLMILFNGDALEPADPFLKTRSTRPFAPDSYYLAGEKIVIEPFILPHPKNLSSEEREKAGDLQRDQGFYIYRNKRLVIWGTWFRLCRKMGLSKLARVKVDIPASAELDRLWDLDVKKANATIPEELKKELGTVVEQLTNRSGRVWTRRARVEQTEKALWVRTKSSDGTVTYAVNESHPLVAELTVQTPVLRPLLKLLSSNLPLNSLYSDLSGDNIVNSETGVEKRAIEELRKMGFDTSTLETRFQR